MTIHARLRKLSSMSGVIFNGVASLVIPAGVTYESLIIKSNLRADQMKEVKITLNTEAIYNPSGLDLVMLQKYKKEPVIENIIVVPFSDTSLNEDGGIRCTSLVTERGDAVLLEISIGAALEGQEPPQIEIWANVSDEQSSRIFMPRMTYQSMQAGAVGDNDFMTLTHAQYRFIKRMFFKAANIESLEIYRDYVEEFKADSDINKMELERLGKKTQDNIFTFDPVARGFIKGYAFPTSSNKELKFRVKCGVGVPNIPILIESCEVVRPDLILNNEA